MRIHRYFLPASLGVFLVTALAAAQTPAAKSQPPSANQQAVEALADRLIAAPDEDARNTLLSENKELVTVELTRALTTKGDQLRRKRGSFAEEHHVYDVALAVAERQNDPKQIGICLSNISLAFKDESDYEQALVYAHKSISTLEPLKEPYLAQVYNNIGVVLKLQGNFTEAVDYYDRALKLSEAQGNKQRIAQASFNLGNVYGDMGNFRLALVEFKRSMELSEALGDQMRLGFNTNSIGSVYETQGDYDLALSYYQQSLKIKEKAANQNEIANVLGNIGWLYHEMGKDAQAQEYLEKALKLKEAAGDKNGAAEALHDEGSVLAEQGNYSEALQRYQASLDVSKALGNKFLVEQTLTEISQAYRAQKDYPHALESAQQALELARQIGSGGVLYPALDATAMALAGSGKPEQARALLAQSISTIEELRGQVAGAEEEQAHFLAKSISPYQHMVELLLAQNKAKEAFTFAEQAKARVLLDVLRSGRVSVDKAMTAEERDEERRHLNRMSSLNARLEAPDPAHRAQLEAQLATARLDYRSFHTTLYAEHPELQVERGEAQPMLAAQTGALLPDARTALLEFVVTEDQSYLFVFTKGASAAGPRLTTYTLPVKEKDLTKRVDRFREQLATRDLDYGRSALSLYRLLLAPARAVLAGKTTMVVVPDGALWELPFQALEPSPTHHLLEQSAISYVPSLTVLAEMMRRHRDNRGEAPRLLALGNPAPGAPPPHEPAATTGALIAQRNVAPHSPSADLPSAEHEVEALARLYGSQRSSVYTQAAASEQTFKTKAPEYDVLHLATHGVFDDRSPMYSHLVLSEGGGGGDEDGLLEAWEVINLDLKADLVVLSACETARGKVSSGEGLIGMSWAFFVAGSPSLVASQWKVDSASTTELMLHFHRGLHPSTGDPSHLQTKARTLQQAELSVTKKPAYRHPFYWAGFVLIGDAR